MNLAAALEAAADLETPLAVRDDTAMERNLLRMASLARHAGIRLRPHAKTHKSPAVARRQMDLGAVGLTVATLQEAEVFADAGITDLVIAHPTVGRAKLSRLGHLCDRLERIAVALDNVAVARDLPGAVEVLWEVDTGQHRIGTAPGEATRAAVAELVGEIGQGRLRGLMTHGGHAYRAAGESAARTAAAAESEEIAKTAQLLRDSGIKVREVSVGSTPTARFAGEFAGISEMRPGTYVYGDAGQVALGSHEIEDCAVAVVATVVSTPAPDRSVVDAGSKSISSDRLVPTLDGYGIVIGHPHLAISRLSEEHAVLTGEPNSRLKVGDRVVLIPAHVCTTVNLHAYLLAFEPGGKAKWDPVTARGWR
ncbi:MAG: alanine racemase [Candidatus Dormibacteraeota bacterium]|nr:alanine racemase [Candidatus Dormibacteraeota bacterium]